MTYGPPPGWNPNQPPAGGYPGYPPQQPGFGYGPPNPYGPQAAPRSPLPIVAGVIALLMFVAFVYTVIADVVGQATGSRFAGPNFNLAFVLDEFRIATKLHLGLVVIDVVFGLVAILWLVGGILLLRRNPVGRTLAFVAAGLTLVIRIFTIATYSGGIYTQYILPVFVIVAVVLLVLPATRDALRTTASGQPAGFVQPDYQQQHAAYPPPPGYPQQQPPGGYRQPPGGMPR